MAEREVMLGKLTRREVREALADGRIQAAIVPVGSIEQHLEHLAMEHDIASATYVAREAALRLYPQVLVAAPMSIGISEHHMMHPGSLTAKPGSWLAVLFDACESLVRAGIHNLLVLNGHGGNVAPVKGSFNQFLRYFDPERVNLHFCSYWDLIPPEVAARAVISGRVPGHAQEFETAMALALFPENVRRECIEDAGAAQATASAGRELAEAAVAAVAVVVEEMIRGIRQPALTGL
jgi:creatinine amidohydrolase